MTLLTFVAFVHIFVAFLLIVLVLLQDSKGGAMGMMGGGGGANTVFGSTGAGNFLTQTTKVVAVVFALTCLSLVYITTSKSNSVLDLLPNSAKTSAPVAPVAPVAPATPETVPPGDAKAAAPAESNEKAPAHQ